MSLQLKMKVKWVGLIKEELCYNELRGQAHTYIQSTQEHTHLTLALLPLDFNGPMLGYIAHGSTIRDQGSFPAHLQILLFGVSSESPVA